MPNLMKNVSWKVERCGKCTSLAVTSFDGFWGCLKCRELPHHTATKYPKDACVFCGKALIFLMDACLTCGNQPREANYTVSPLSCIKTKRHQRKIYQRVSASDA